MPATTRDPRTDPTLAAIALAIAALLALPACNDARSGAGAAPGSAGGSGGSGSGGGSGSTLPPGYAAIDVDATASLGTFPDLALGTLTGPFAVSTDPGFALSQEAGFRVLEVMCRVRIPTDPTNPASYDFSSLDSAVAGVFGSGAEPLIWFAPSSRPTNLTTYGQYITGVARHLLQGWGGGSALPVRLFRFGNEPDLTIYWQGTRTDFFDTYAAFARSLKAVDPAIVIDALCVSAAASVTPGSGRTVNPWIPDFLAYCQTNGVPVDLVSAHAYSALPYYKFGTDFDLVAAEVARYPTLSPIYGTPHLANDEWNILVGDLWSGSYHPEFDTAFVAAHNAVALATLLDHGVLLSIRYGGTFNDGGASGHDFPITDGYGQRKPAFYAFQAFSNLAGTTRLVAAGGDGANVGVAAGVASDGSTVVVLGIQDIERYMTTYAASSTLLWAEYSDYLAEKGLSAPFLPGGYRLRVSGMASSGPHVFERYLVDDTHDLELVETGSMAAGAPVEITRALSAPCVELIRIRP